jgi:hypothetical protein
MMQRFFLLIVLMFMLAACGDVAGNSSDTVEKYLEAKVSGNAELIGQLLCSEMESDLAREVASFASVDARLEGLSCSADGEIVSCEGEIVATYGTEDRAFPLSSYRVVQEDGEWRWCGESS